MIEIKRGETYQKYEVSSNQLILEALEEIRREDPTLCFRSGCRSGVCGSCAIRVNNQEKLACSSKIEDNDVLEPLKYHKVIRDLVVDFDDALLLLSKSGAYFDSYEKRCVSIEDSLIVKKESDCILCHSCFSACPVMEVNSSFLGPFALSRVYRYEFDAREDDKRSKIERIQKDGIWDCTLCGECSVVCPQEIDPKGDISSLRAKSGVLGLLDPNMGNFSSFGMTF